MQGSSSTGASEVRRKENKVDGSGGDVGGWQFGCCRLRGRRRVAGTKKENERERTREKDSMAEGERGD